jgi:hypothetical protein
VCVLLFKITESSLRQHLVLLLFIYLSLVDENSALRIIECFYYLGSFNAQQALASP